MVCLDLSAGDGRLLECTHMPQWDADLYLRFAGERTQPAIDLIQRIQLRAPQRIIDLGCGPGNSTAALRRRWPEATIIGLDTSIPMLETARQEYPNGIWEVGDAGSWRAAEPFDLVFSNAMLHWLPDPEGTCRHWLDQLRPGGALAVQVPAHYDSPVHRQTLEVANHPAWSDRMQGARIAATHRSPAFFYDVLVPLVSRLDLWETIYYHALAGPEGVVEWFRGTGLRPFLAALSSDEERQLFEHMLLQRYTAAYPRRPNGQVLFPFRRLFFVAYRD